MEEDGVETEANGILLGLPRDGALTALRSLVLQVDPWMTPLLKSCR